MRRAVLPLAVVVLAVGLALARTAAADAYVRVIAQRAPVHTGPAASYREIYFAKRGEVFEVLERGTKDYWFKVALDDGTTGWILGDMVYPFDVVEEGEPGAFTRMGRAIRRAILGPSPVPYASVEVSFSAGMLDQEGMYLLRPAYFFDPYFAIEGFAGISPRGTKDVFLGGVGWTLRMVPGAVIDPFINAGIGAAYIRPKADNFVDPEETQMALDAGLGLEITFKKQITVRIDARNWTLFNENKSSNGQELTGGLAIFF